MENNINPAQEITTGEPAAEPVAEQAVDAVTETAGSAAAPETGTRQKPKKKMGCFLKGCLISMLVSVVLTVLSVGLVAVGIGLISSNAEKMMEAGDYEAASLYYGSLEAIPGYADKKKECDLLLIRQLMDGGYHDDALAFIEQLEDSEEAGGLKKECVIAIAVESYRDGDFISCCKHAKNYMYTDDIAKLYYDLGMLGIYSENDVNEFDRARSRNMLRNIISHSSTNEDAAAATKNPLLFETRLYDIYWMEEETEYYFFWDTVRNTFYVDMPGDDADAGFWSSCDEEGLHFYLDTSMQSDSPSADTYWFSITGFSEYDTMTPDVMYVTTCDGERREFRNCNE